MSWKKWYDIFLEEMKKEMKKSPDPSPSHQKDHIVRVWKNSKILCEKLNGDLEVMVAAVMLHDLGRHHGLKIHGKKSAELAKPILEKHGFPKDKISKVLEAIAQHDYGFSSEKIKLLESKILNDADRVDAFGVIGVYRHILFIEAGRIKMGDVIRLSKRRWESLTLPETKDIAKGDYEYIVNFFKTLKEEFDEEGG